MTVLLLAILLGAVSVALCVHAIRSGRDFFWCTIILLFQPLGPIIYIVGILIPDLLKGPRVQQWRSRSKERLDPQKDYREARAASELTPTAGNLSRLAEQASLLGRHDEAEAAYGQAAQGIHAEDPVLLLGRAVALIELDRPTEALVLLERLGKNEDKGRTPAAALALGRAHGALGHIEAADTAYQWAAIHMPGLEALGRYVAFMARQGRTDEAKEALADMDQRIAGTNAHFRKEAQAWRDLAWADLKA